MTVTASQLMEDAISYDQPLLAHALFVGLQSGQLKPEDDMEGYDYSVLDLDQVYDLNCQNVLGIRPVRLYAVPTDPEIKAAAYILAHDRASAEACFVENFQRVPGKVIDVSVKMDHSLYYEEFKATKSFWEIRKETQHFPRFVAEICK